MKYVRRILPALLYLSMIGFDGTAAAASVQQQIDALKSTVSRQQDALLDQQNEIRILIAKAQAKKSISSPSLTSHSITTVHYTSTPASQIPIAKRAFSADYSFTFPSRALEIVHGSGKLIFSGLIDPLFMTASDGDATHAFFTTNSVVPSKYTIQGIYSPSTRWTVGGNFQIGFYVNQSNAVSQTNPSPGNTLNVRKAEVYVKSKTFGELYLGQGNTATDDIAYTGFSGTKVLARATVEDIGGGLFYRLSNTKQLSAVTVGSTIDGLDGFARKMRVRYNTPTVAGFDLQASASEGDRQDIALKFAREFGGIDFAVQFAATSKQTISSGSNIAIGKVLNFSAGIMLPNGVNLAGSWADVLAQENGRDNPRYFYIKPGFQHKFFPVGKTAMSFDLGRYYNFAQNNDIAKTYGLQVVQNLNAYSLAVYTGYRYFDLDRSSLSTKSINLFLLGALMKF